MENEFNLNIVFKGKKINFRKWKVKDKNKFIQAIKLNSDINEVSNALVYDCIDTDMAFSKEEFKYILAIIRNASLGSVKYDFICNKCSKEYTHEADLSKVLKQEFKKYSVLKYKNFSIEMHNIVNRNFYIEYMKKAKNNEEQYLIDFMFHVKKFNNNDSFNFEQLSEMIENLDIDIAEEIFKLWDEMKFKINDIHEVQCPHCNDKENIQFDEFPNFLPESWLK